MIKSGFILWIILLIGNSCLADTIDYWHVYYNKLKVREFNQSNSNKTIKLKIASIKSSDSLVVKYFKDTCFDCLTTVLVEDDKGHLVTVGHNFGTSTGVTIRLKNITMQDLSSTKLFRIYYYENADPQKRTFLFQIKLE